MRRTLLAGCFFSAVAPLAAQNTCATALSVGEGTHVVDVLDGTNQPGNNCEFGNGMITEWYTFTNPVDTGVVIRTDVVGPPYTDTRVQVYSGTCNALICLDGDDDSGEGYASIVEFFAEAGVTYYFNFDNGWSTEGFTFSIGLFPPPPTPLNLIDFVNVDLPDGDWYMGCVDMNGDGLDDLVAPGSDNIHIGYQQPGGSFNHVDIPTADVMHPASWSLTVGDLDKNGANDLLYGAGDGVTFMFANEDGTAFTEYSFSEYVFCQRTNMADLNNDGHLDGFSCHDVDANVAFINDGTGSLAFVQGGYGETCGNYGSVFTDYNNDGLVDLFVAKCGCDPNDLLMPNSPGGVFTNVAPDLGLSDSHQSWSSAWGDFDNDGDMDVMIGSSSSSIHKFMRNNGDGTFVDVTNEVGANANLGQSIEWTTHDFNNDGWLDILGGAGMLMNDGDGTFTMDNSVPYNGAIGDVDNDGYLDIVGYTTMSINQSAGNNWLRVHPVGSVSNSNGIGARIRVITPAGAQIRDVKAGDGFRHMSSLLAHFGLGSATSATVQIHWPSGIVDEIPNVTANTVLTVNEGTFSSIREEMAAELLLFPVPATSQLTIGGQAQVRNGPVRIFNSTGALVRAEYMTGNTVDIAALRTGVYQIEVTTRDGVLKQRFVKE